MLNLVIESNQLTISGALNMHTLKDDAWKSLSTNQIRQLTNLGEVGITFDDSINIDSAGLAWLLNFKKDAANKGVQLSFAVLPDSLEQLAKLSGVDHLFN